MLKSFYTSVRVFSNQHFYLKHLVAVIILFISGVINAQEPSAQAIPLSMLEQNFNSLSLDEGNILIPSASVQSDSVFQTHKLKLMPDNMSFAERGLWGEEGLFRKISLVAPLSREERKYELDIRRTMLTAHQIGGFATLGLMLTTAYFGQRVIDGRRDLGDVHQGFVAATIASYSLTGLLAVLSPPPLIRRDESSTTSLHKTLAWVHLAGMIITPILGSMIGEHRQFHMDKAHYHQIAGYLTTAAFAASLIVITF